MIEKMNCPFCHEGVMTHGIKEEEFTYKDNALIVMQPGMHCNHCDESILSASDLEANRLELTNFKNSVDNDLTI